MQIQKLFKQNSDFNSPLINEIFKHMFNFIAAN